MMPSITTPRASKPLVTSSSPTEGPTNSVRRRVTSGSSAFSATITCSLCWAEVTSFCTGMRIITSRAVPKFCTVTSV